MECCKPLFAAASWLAYCWASVASLLSHFSGALESSARAAMRLVEIAQGDGGVMTTTFLVDFEGGGLVGVHVWTWYEAKI